MNYTTLVSIEELQSHLPASDWRVIDCRHDLMDFDAGYRSYCDGHIPHAVFASVENELSGRKSGSNGRHPLPNRSELVATFRSWGVNNSTQIVAYDAQGGIFAARLWWLARWLGHENAAVLDGGWPAWLKATSESSTDRPEPKMGGFTAKPPLVGTVDARQVLAAIGNRTFALLDARAKERFHGLVEPLDPVAGHIPGARNRFWQSNLSDGKFKAAEELRREFDELLAGQAPSRVLHYCGSGVTAAHNVLAMECAGLTGSLIYAGSWSEWVADQTHPVARDQKP